MFPQFIVQILVTLLIVGVLLWGLGQITFIDEAMKRVIRVILIVLVAIWLIYILGGLLGGTGGEVHSHGWHFWGS